MHIKAKIIVPIILLFLSANLPAATPPSASVSQAGETRTCATLFTW